MGVTLASPSHLEPLQLIMTADGRWKASQQSHLPPSVPLGGSHLALWTGDSPGGVAGF